MSSDKREYIGAHLPLIGALYDAVKSGLADTVSDMIWTWSVPHFEVNQISEE